jgi:uridine phosphorylase
VETAVRDDGISDHYLPPGDTVDADESLTEALLAAARTVQPHARRHISWTIPAVFRQTQPEVDHCINQGITVVESEIAALLAVCQARNVGAAAIVTILSVEPPADDSPADWAAIASTQWDIFEAVIAALRSG